MKAVEVLFLFSGGLTVAYMTKLFVALFVEENASEKVQKKYDRQKKYMNSQSSLALGISGAALLVWGLLPQHAMDRAAQMAQGMMGLLEFGEPVDYFTIKNLAGAGISILIGILVYVLIVRKYLMKKEGRQRQYVNPWPLWMDLEELIYRPLFGQFLPLVGGFFCRILDSFLDGVVVLLRRSIYRDSPLPHERTEGTWFTDGLGVFLNRFRDVANSTWRRKNPIRRDYVHFLAVRHAESRKNSVVIRRSMSFALLLTCIGFMMTMIYLILLW